MMKFQKKHKTNPEFYAHPDDYKITEGIEYTNNRAEYTRMVKNGEIEPGHHKLGIADGGKNIQSNITYTGEKFLNRKLLPKDVLEYYDSVYGTKSNPHPKRIAIFEENGIVQFGKDPKHTEATALQQKIHIWQKEKGIRKQQKMIDSVVFIKQDIEDVINYYLSISDSERIVENENIIVDNLLFKEKNDWTYIINLEGDAFSEEFLLELSKERQLIYYYTDDSQLDSEFVVINCNKISRKRYIYGYP